MRCNKELLRDIIYRKKKSIELYIKELNESMNMMSDEEKNMHLCDLTKGNECISFLDEFINNNDLTYSDLRKMLNELENVSFDRRNFVKISKIKVMKELLKEYKKEYCKNYFNNKYVGLNGLFDNHLFCSIIKRKIDRFTYCNKVTRSKYKHLTSFLTELLNEMEMAEDPLKVLKYKMKIYQKYKKHEYIEIRKHKVTKISVIKGILDEYKKEKQMYIRCK